MAPCQVLRRYHARLEGSESGDGEGKEGRGEKEGGERERRKNFARVNFTQIATAWLVMASRRLVEERKLVI